MKQQHLIYTEQQRMKQALEDIQKNVDTAMAKINANESMSNASTVNQSQTTSTRQNGRNKSNLFATAGKNQIQNGANPQPVTQQ